MKELDRIEVTVTRITYGFDESEFEKEGVNERCIKGERTFVKMDGEFYYDRYIANHLMMKRPLFGSPVDCFWNYIVQLFPTNNRRNASTCNRIPAEIKLADSIHQSKEASVSPNHLIAQRLEELETQRRNLLFLVCRILQAAPGYKLRPSELAVETVGDLSFLSQEMMCSLLNRMVRENPVHSSIRGI